MVLDRGRGQAVRGSAGHGEVCFILSTTEGNDEMTRTLKNHSGDLWKVLLHRGQSQKKDF